MDRRSRVEKLLAMAQQEESPSEAEVARLKLETMGAWPPPPNRPTTTSAGSEGGWFTSSSTSTVTYTFNVVFVRWNRTP